MRPAGAGESRESNNTTDLPHHPMRAFCVVAVAVLTIGLTSTRYAQADESRPVRPDRLYVSSSEYTDSEVRNFPGVRQDFPPPTAEQYGRTGTVFFVDGGPVFSLRTVGFADAPEEYEGSFLPHIFVGLGIWFGDPHGIGENADDLFSDLKRPFGIRLGVTWGGQFPFIDGSIDVAAAGPDDFTHFEIEFEIMGPWWAWGVGPDLIISEWDFVSVTNNDLEFRGTVIPAGSELKQSINQYGLGVPITIAGDWDLTLFEERVPTLFGLYFKYNFLLLGVESPTPAIKDNVENHVASFGLWIDWGIARFLRFQLRVAVGNIVTYENFVGELKASLTFRHIPVFWLDGHVELLAKFEVELITHGLGDRYLHDVGNTDVASNTVAWVGMKLRIGIRIWF